MYLKKRLEELKPEKAERLIYLDRNSGKFQKGLTVTTDYLPKGLEFDSEYGVFSGQEKTPLKIPAEDITATRALHELFMYRIS